MERGFFKRVSMLCGNSNAICSGNGGSKEKEWGYDIGKCEIFRVGCGCE